MASVPAYAFGVGTFAVPESPTAIAVGDFNGDGRLDLAVTSGYVLANGMVSILLGRVDGSFPPAVNYQVSSPVHVNDVVDLLFNSCQLSITPRIGFRRRLHPSVDQAEQVGLYL